MAALILISGEEEFLIERAALEEATLSLSDEILHFEEADDLYVQESQCSVFGGGKRTYIIWNCDELPSMPDNQHDTLIVVSGKKALAHPNAKRALKFPKLKAYPENNEVLGWILKEGQRHNIDLSRVAGALFVNTGSSLRKLASEIDKLALVASSDRIITPEQARSLLCFSAELTPKEIIDSICEGQTSRSLAFLDKLQERADETGWILAYMQRHVLQQLRFELLVEKKAPDDRASTILGVHPFVLKRMYVTRRGLWSRSSLQQSINTLCELDIAHKRGSPWASTGLELEIVRLSEEAKNVKR